MTQTRFDTRVYGRVLVCTFCRRSVDVLEAAYGAAREDDHLHLEPSTYVCGECENPPLISDMELC